MGWFTFLRHKDSKYNGMGWGAFAFAWQLLFVLAPLMTIVSFVFRMNIVEQFFALSGSIFFSALWRSTGYALVTAFICLVIAYPLVYYLVFRAFRFRLVGLFLIIVPFWTNFFLHVYAWFFILDTHGVLNIFLQKTGLIAQPHTFLNTPGAVLVMMVYYYLPFMVLPLYTAMEKIDSRLFEVAYDLGAHFMQVVRRVLFPLTCTGIFSGFSLVFVPAFGEFAIPEVMGGDRVLFIGSLISQSVLSGESLALGALLTCISAAWLVGFVLVIWLCLQSIKKLAMR